MMIFLFLNLLFPLMESAQNDRYLQITFLGASKLHYFSDEIHITISTNTRQVFKLSNIFSPEMNKKICLSKVLDLRYFQKLYVSASSIKQDRSLGLYGVIENKGDGFANEKVWFTSNGKMYKFLMRIKLVEFKSSFVLNRLSLGYKIIDHELVKNSVYSSLDISFKSFHSKTTKEYPNMEILEETNIPTIFTGFEIYRMIEKAKIGYVFTIFNSTNHFITKYDFEFNIISQPYKYLIQFDISSTENIKMMTFTLDVDESMLISDTTNYCYQLGNKLKCGENQKDDCFNKLLSFPDCNAISDEEIIIKNPFYKNSSIKNLDCYHLIKHNTNKATLRKIANCKKNNCLPGWAGIECDKISCKELHLCKNGGVCNLAMETRICSCPQGFKGRYCEIVNTKTIISNPRLIKF